MPGARVKKAVASVVVFALLYGTVGTPLAEANFWSERRAAASAVRDESANTPEPTRMAALAGPSMAAAMEITKGLPGLQANALSASLQERLTKNISANTLKPYQPLLNALSPAYGTVREVYIPSEAKADFTVVHVQDVHLNAEAQANIGHAIEGLLGAGQADVIALEGAFGEIDVERFRKFPHREAIRGGADFLLANNEISGAAHAAMTVESSAPVIGVDEKTAYDANVQAYRDSEPLKKEFGDHWAGLKKDLEERKAKTFNKELADYDGKMEAYRHNKLSLSEYVKLVARRGNPSAGVKALLKAIDMENALDFKDVERERGELLRKLVARMGKDDVSDLMRMSVSYRMGNVRYSEFYGYLEKLCRKCRVELRDYPAMKNYIEYVLLADKIDANELFTELARLEDLGYASLATVAGEKELVQESRRLVWVEKLLAFTLTPTEWMAYAKDAEASRRLFGKDLTVFERFYREADARSLAITANVEKAMKEKGGKVCVLVTGGFHTEELEGLMRQRKVPFVTYAPKISKVDTEAGSSYLSVFTREKTPLEKLFQGEKLFVSPHPLPVRAEPWMAAVGVVQYNLPVMETFKALAGFKANILKATADIQARTASIVVILDTGVKVLMNLRLEDGRVVSKEEKVVRYFLWGTALLSVTAGVTAVVRFLITLAPVASSGFLQAGILFTAALTIFMAMASLADIILGMDVLEQTGVRGLARTLGSLPARFQEYAYAVTGALMILPTRGLMSSLIKGDTGNLSVLYNGPWDWIMAAQKAVQDFLRWYSFLPQESQLVFWFVVAGIVLVMIAIPIVYYLTSSEKKHRMAYLSYMYLQLEGLSIFDQTGTGIWAWEKWLVKVSEGNEPRVNSWFAQGIKAKEFAPSMNRVHNMALQIQRDGELEILKNLIKVDAESIVKVLEQLDQQKADLSKEKKIKFLKKKLREKEFAVWLEGKTFKLNLYKKKQRRDGFVYGIYWGLLIFLIGSQISFVKGWRILNESLSRLNRLLDGPVSKVNVGAPIIHPDQRKNVIAYLALNYLLRISTLAGEDVSSEVMEKWLRDSELGYVRGIHPALVQGIKGEDLDVYVMNKRRESETISARQIPEIMQDVFIGIMGPFAEDWGVRQESPQWGAAWAWGVGALVVMIGVAVFGGALAGVVPAGADLMAGISGEYLLNFLSTPAGLGTVLAGVALFGLGGFGLLFVLKGPRAVKKDNKILARTMTEFIDAMWEADQGEKDPPSFHRRGGKKLFEEFAEVFMMDRPLGSTAGDRGGESLLVLIKDGGRPVATLEIVGSSLDEFSYTTFVHYFNGTSSITKEIPANTDAFGDFRRWVGDIREKYFTDSKWDEYKLASMANRMMADISVLSEKDGGPLKGFKKVPVRFSFPTKTGKTLDPLGVIFDNQTLNIELPNLWTAMILLRNPHHVGRILAEFARLKFFSETNQANPGPISFNFLLTKVMNDDQKSFWKEVLSALEKKKVNVNATIAALDVSVHHGKAESVFVREMLRADIRGADSNEFSGIYERYQSWREAHYSWLRDPRPSAKKYPVEVSNGLMLGLGAMGLGAAQTFIYLPPWLESIWNATKILLEPVVAWIMTTPMGEWLSMLPQDVLFGIIVVAFISGTALILWASRATVTMVIRLRLKFNREVRAKAGRVVLEFMEKGNALEALETGINIWDWMGVADRYNSKVSTLTLKWYWKEIFNKALDKIIYAKAISKSSLKSGNYDALTILLEMKEIAQADVANGPKSKAGSANRATKSSAEVQNGLMFLFGGAGLAKIMSQTSGTAAQLLEWPSLDSLWDAAMMWFNSQSINVQVGLFLVPLAIGLGSFAYSYYLKITDPARIENLARAAIRYFNRGKSFIPDPGHEGRLGVRLGKYLRALQARAGSSNVAAMRAIAEEDLNPNSSGYLIGKLLGIKGNALAFFGTAGMFIDMALLSTVSVYASSFPMGWLYAAAFNFFVFSAAHVILEWLIDRDAAKKANDGRVVVPLWSIKRFPSFGQHFLFTTPYLLTPIFAPVFGLFRSSLTLVFAVVVHGIYDIVVTKGFGLYAEKQLKARREKWLEALVNKGELPQEFKDSMLPGKDIDEFLRLREIVINQNSGTGAYLMEIPASGKRFLVEFSNEGFVLIPPGEEFKRIQYSNEEAQKLLASEMLLDGIHQYERLIDRTVLAWIETMLDSPGEAVPVSEALRNALAKRLRQSQVYNDYSRAFDVLLPTIDHVKKIRFVRMPGGRILVQRQIKGDSFKSVMLDPKGSMDLIRAALPDWELEKVVSDHRSSPPIKNIPTGDRVLSAQAKAALKAMRDASGDIRLNGNGLKLIERGRSGGMDYEVFIIPDSSDNLRVTRFEDGSLKVGGHRFTQKEADIRVVKRFLAALTAASKSAKDLPSPRDTGFIQRIRRAIRELVMFQDSYDEKNSKRRYVGGTLRAVLSDENALNFAQAHTGDNTLGTVDNIEMKIYMEWRRFMLAYSRWSGAAGLSLAAVVYAVAQGGLAAAFRTAAENSWLAAVVLVTVWGVSYLIGHMLGHAAWNELRPGAEAQIATKFETGLLAIFMDLSNNKKESARDRFLALVDYLKEIPEHTESVENIYVNDGRYKGRTIEYRVYGFKNVFLRIPVDNSVEGMWLSLTKGDIGKHADPEVLGRIVTVISGHLRKQLEPDWVKLLGNEGSQSLMPAVVMFGLGAAAPFFQQSTGLLFDSQPISFDNILGILMVIAAVISVILAAYPRKDNYNVESYGINWGVFIVLLLISAVLCSMVGIFNSIVEFFSAALVAPSLGAVIGPLLTSAQGLGHTVVFGLSQLPLFIKPLALISTSSPATMSLGTLLSAIPNIFSTILGSGLGAAAPFLQEATGGASMVFSVLLALVGGILVYKLASSLSEENKIMGPIFGGIGAILASLFIFGFSQFLAPGVSVFFQSFAQEQFSWTVFWDLVGDFIKALAFTAGTIFFKSRGWGGGLERSRFKGSYVELCMGPHYLHRMV